MEVVWNTGLWGNLKELQNIRKQQFENTYLKALIAEAKSSLKKCFDQKGYD